MPTQRKAVAGHKETTSVGSWEILKKNFSRKIRWKKNPSMWESSKSKNR